MKDQLNCNMYTRHHIAGGGCGTSAELSLDAYQVDNLSGGPSNVLTVGVSQPLHTSNVVLTNYDHPVIYNMSDLCHPLPHPVDQLLHLVT